MFSERWVSVLLDVVFEGILVHDGHAITDANERVARMLGFASPAEMVGLPYAALLTTAGNEDARARVEQGHSGRYRAEFRHQDGSVFALDINARETRYEGRRARVVALRLPDDAEPADNPLIQRATALDRTVQALADTIEQRDSFTAGHQDRVSHLAVQVADRLGVDAGTMATIRMAAHVHDIGKIAIPAEILMKPTSLSPEEFQLVKGHVVAGHRILQAIAFDGPVAEAVLMVVDVYDALSSARPYREGLTPGRAIEMMQDQEAGRLDTEVLRHLAAVVL